MTNFLYFLLHSDGASVGEAFKDAINSYIVHNEICADKQNRTVAVATLYGIPNYRLSSPEGTMGVNINRKSTSISVSNENTQEGWSINIEDLPWSLEENGIVRVPGASYLENTDTPILPVISFQRLLPSGSSVVSVTWNQSQSMYDEIEMNDIPLPVVGIPALGSREGVTMTGSFTHTGYYPSIPHFVSDISDFGGGRWIELQVIPVQYNQATHTTKIWTDMVFDVEYDVASSFDSDGDGLPDYWEKAYNLDPKNDSGDHGPKADIDGDGLSNLEEYNLSTHPRDRDTDKDQSADGTEILLGTDPNNPYSKALKVYLPLVTRSQ
jgi:hypothetical protein